MKKNLFPLITALLILIADQLTKLIFIGQAITTITLHYRYLFFVIVIFLVILSLIKNYKYTKLQRWILWMLISGFIGSSINSTNIFHIDILGLNPDFNIANLTVVISALIMLLSILIKDRRIH